MIAEVVTFPLSAEIDRNSAIALYRKTSAKWAENPDLIRKYYIFDEARHLGGGVYIWPSRDAAARWHGDDFKEMIRSLYGSYPSIEVFEVLIDVDPASGSIIEF
jgi:hypothetical protein